MGFDGHERMGIKRFVGQVIIDRDESVYLSLLFAFPKLHGNSFRGDSHFFALNTNDLDSIAQAGDVFLHVEDISAFPADDRLEEGSFGVQLHIRQLADVQQRQFLLHKYK